VIGNAIGVMKMLKGKVDDGAPGAGRKKARSGHAISAIRGIKIDLNDCARSDGRKFDGLSAGVLDKSSIEAPEVPNAALVTDADAGRESKDEGRFGGGSGSCAIEREMIDASPHPTAARHDV